MNPLPGQMELATVIDHKRNTMKDYYDSAIELDQMLHPFVNPQEATHKPAGVRLAKLLHQYDNSPSSELWRTIQALSYEILRDAK